MKKMIAVLLALAVFCSLLPTWSAGLPAEAAARFPLFAEGKAADLYVSAADYPQIVRAAGDLQKDVERVTAALPEVKTDTSALGQYAVIIGSVEKSPVIAQLMEQGLLDEAKALSGKFEAFVIKMVENPLPGVKSALVIAGSDKRGTVYGIYDVSEQIGVSPYYWWADVTPKQQSELLLDGGVKTEGEPSVKYRGIFINDERNLTEWSAQFASEETPGTPNAGTYEKVFELLLRLRLNTLWPAMHNYSEAFNLREDENGVPINAKLADSYGIIMGASHCEMLLRNNEGEWNRWANANSGKYDAAGKPVYDYTVNPKALEAYWRERVEKNKDFEGIYNIGMRGIHDSGMTFQGLSNPTLAQKIAVLQEVIDCQRRILSEVLGKPAEEIPQAFIPYKEAAEYYNGNATTPGVQIPEDVILMWAEDNHGYLRQTPTEAERQRSGGSGVYYHVSYWGVANTSYLWLNTTPLSQMYEELKKAYDTGAQKYWILNVGDIKPSEISLEFFANLSRNIDFCDDTNIEEYIARTAQRDFLLDGAQAAEVADILTHYYQYNIAKRPEFQGYESSNGNDPYSVTANGDEAQIRVDQLRALADRAGAIYDAVDPARRDAFYEMFYYPLRSSANSLAMHVYWQKNQLYKKQGRYASVRKYQDLSVAAYDGILSDMIYYNKTIRDGKWDKIMNPYNGSIPVAVGLRSFATVEAADAKPGIGAVCEGQELPGDAVTLTFSSLSDNRRFIDIYSREEAANDWTVEVSDDFIQPSETSGSVAVETRIWIGIDWSKAKRGENTGMVTVRDTKGTEIIFQVSANKTASRLSGKTYAEENGLVAIEAEHYSESVAKNGCAWRVVKNLGRSGDSMKLYPDLAPRVDKDFENTAAQLKYNIYFESSGTFTGTLYRIPTLNEGGENGVAKTCRIAVGMEGKTPQVLSGNATCVDVNSRWKRNTLENIEKLTFTVQVDQPGVQTLVVYQSDSGIAFDRVVINTGGEISSYLGPAESYNTISFTKAPESRLPEEADNEPPRKIELYQSADDAAPAIPVQDCLTMTPGDTVLLTGAVTGDLPADGIAWSVASGAEAVDLQPRADGSATLRASQAGEAILLAAAKGAGLTRYCKVIVSDTREVAGEFLEQNGEVMIDIVSALEQSPYANYSDSATHAWQLNADGNALTVQPDIGIKWQGDAKASTAVYDSAFLSAYAPQLNFQIYFEHTGTYYIHTLSSHPIDASDSYHVGLDGVWQMHTNYATHQGKLRWEKRDSGWFITVDTPGVHTLNIWPREDGIVSHRIYLTQTVGKSYFGGWGPAESARRTAAVGDKTALQALVTANASRKESGYTADSWAAFAKAYAAALERLGSRYTAQKELDAAAALLESAVSALQKNGWQEVAAQIDALPDRYTLTLSDAAAVAEARAAYDALDPSEQQRVENLPKLLALEKDLEIFASGQRGDVDQDGKRTVSDVVLLRSVIVSGERLPAAQFWSADLDEDGKLTVTDVIALRQMIVKA